MSKLTQGVPPAIITAIHSPRWASQVQNRIESLPVAPRVHWLIDIDSVRELTIANHDAALIVECPEAFGSNPKALLDSMTGFCDNAQNCPFFLLGDQTVEPWRQVLVEAGATEVCTSILDFQKMWQRVARHLKISTTDDLTVEQTVAARLPW